MINKTSQNSFQCCSSSIVVTTLDSEVPGSSPWKRVQIYIYKEDCLRLCLNAFAQFSRYRAETLRIG